MVGLESKLGIRECVDYAESKEPIACVIIEDGAKTTPFCVGALVLGKVNEKVTGPVSAPMVPKLIKVGAFTECREDGEDIIPGGQANDEGE